MRLGVKVFILLLMCYSAKANEIQFNIDEAGMRGGGVVSLDDRRYEISETIVIDSHNVTLEGLGSGGQVARPPDLMRTAGTTLVWVGEAGGTMIKHTAKNDEYSPSCKGGGIRNLHLDGNNIAGTGIQHSSVWSGRYENILISDTRDWGIVMDVVEFASHVGERTSGHNEFRNITIRQWKSRTGGGIVMAGDSLADAHSNVFSNIYVIHQNGNGLDIRVGDNNTFTAFTFYRPGFLGTGDAIVFRSGEGRADFARNNTFFGVQSSSNVNGGRIRSVAGNVRSSLARNNVIYGLNSGNSDPRYMSPVIEEGTELSIR